MTKKALIIVYVVFVGSFLINLGHIAGSSPVINYQGRLTDPGGTPITGNYTMEFSLYNVETGGSALWTETQSLVPVSNGFFSVKLGSITSLSTVDFSKDLWLGIKVGIDSEMIPRLKLEDVPHALGSKDDFVVPVGGRISITGEPGLLSDIITYGDQSPFWTPGMLFTVHPTRHFHFGTLDGTTWSEKVTFLNNGDVGIGTSAPEAKLHVAGDGLQEITAIKIGNYAAGGRQYLQIDVENSDPLPSSCDEISEKGDSQLAPPVVSYPAWSVMPLVIRRTM